MNTMYNLTHQLSHNLSQYHKLFNIISPATCNNLVTIILTILAVIAIGYPLYCLIRYHNFDALSGICIIIGILIITLNIWLSADPDSHHYVSNQELNARNDKIVQQINQKYPYITLIGTTSADTIDGYSATYMLSKEPIATDDAIKLINKSTIASNEDHILIQFTSNLGPENINHCNVLTKYDSDQSNDSDSSQALQSRINQSTKTTLDKLLEKSR